MLFISHRGNLHGPNPVLENTISYIDKALQDGFACEVDVIDYDDNGVFTLGHAPSSSFDELIRITQPGGHIAFSLRTDVYQDGGFKEKQDALESAGAWKLAKVTEPFQPLPKGEPEVFHQIWAYQVI